MSKIVLGKIDSFDFLTTTEDITVLENAENVAVANTAVLEATTDHLQAVENSGKKVYIPATLLTKEQVTNENIHVYFDLENYPFYQAAKRIVEQDAKPKGVFRFRRTVTPEDNALLFASDLYVLSSLLGEAEEVTVRSTDMSVVPSHTILMLNFGGGTMAHIEYTVSNEQRIELEWSGIKNIIEFDSNEMRPILPANKTKLPLTYTVDKVLASARKVDQALIDQINHYAKLINGGAGQ